MFLNEIYISQFNFCRFSTVIWILKQHKHQKNNILFEWYWPFSIGLSTAQDRFLSTEIAWKVVVYTSMKFALILRVHLFMLLQRTNIMLVKLHLLSQLIKPRKAIEMLLCYGTYYGLFYICVIASNKWYYAMNYVLLLWINNYLN